MKWIVGAALILSACSMDTSAIAFTTADDGAGPSGGDASGLPIIAPADANADTWAMDAAADAIDADADAPDSGRADAGPPDVGPSDAPAACVPTAETCDAVDQDCDGVIDEDTTCPCPRESFGGSTYLFCTGTDDYAGSRARCRSVGYELVSINDAAEDDWLWGRIDAMTGDEVWVGLTDAVSEGTYVWPDGTVQRTPSGDVAYSGWGAGRPDAFTPEEDCVELDRGRAGDWEDVPCDQLQAAICEAP